MSFRRTSFLLFAAMLLFGAWLLLQQRGVKPPQVGRPLFTSSLVQRADVIVDRYGKKVLIIHKKGTTWYVTHPKKGKANVAAIRQLLGSLAQLIPTKQFTSKHLSKGYGLTPTQGSLTLYHGPNRLAKLYIGNLTPGKNGYYVQTQKGQQVAVLPIGTIDSLTQLALNPPLS